MEITQEQLNTAVTEVMLMQGSQRYENRRHQTAAHFVAAQIVAGEYNSISLRFDSVQEALIETAIALADKLIVALADNSLSGKKEEGES